MCHELIVWITTTLQFHTKLIAYEEDFQADRQDRESAQDKLAEREKEWIDHLADLSQERDRLAEEISLLSKRIVEVKTEVCL